MYIINSLFGFLATCFGDYFAIIRPLNDIQYWTILCCCAIGIPGTYVNKVYNITYFLIGKTV
jgi:hypothetical protein